MAAQEAVERCVIFDIAAMCMRTILYIRGAATAWLCDVYYAKRNWLHCRAGLESEALQIAF